ncbi:phorbol esters/diacylglycerol binding domain protein [Dictyocaulus viviparus]|uniref:Phorbol esters/diacylglycerol binding domain protein n=1 Tax=Dictyocaulus viviparus TaxID=29172 RepID=A0A0D8XMR7_DICVI|nr:phorbol esters/diacylglycerol binding domain protein [Dictyocaulus viviparus]
MNETLTITKSETLTSIDSTASHHIWKAWSSKGGTTICAMCRGKIWLKSANSCQRCLVICHHKCVERAASGIVCIPRTTDEEVNQLDDARMSDVRLSCETELKDEYDTYEKSSTSQSTHSHLTRGDDVEVTSRRARLRNKMTERLSSWRRGSKTTSKLDLDIGVNRHSNELEASAEDLLSKEDSSGAMVNIKEYLADFLPTLDGSPSIDSLYFQPGDAYNEQTIRHAKHLGKEIFSNLKGEERKAKINEQIDLIQLAIKETKDGRLNALMKDGAENKSSVFKRLDERLQALAVVMLHYCAALQDCESQEREAIATDSLCENDVLETQSQSYLISNEPLSTNENSNTAVFEATDGYGDLTTKSSIKLSQTHFSMSGGDECTEDK